MSLLKYIERVNRMHDLIQRKCTGNSIEFAGKLGISRSLLMEHLRDLRQLGADIRFNEARNSYFYERDFTLFNSPDLNTRRSLRSPTELF